MAKPKAKTKTRARPKAKPRAKARAKAPSSELPRITLSSLRRPPGSHRARIRKGRGPGSGIGKTAGRGGKGQTARAGGQARARWGGRPEPAVRPSPQAG